MTPVRSIALLLLFVAVTFTAAWLGSAVTRPAIPVWYASLQKPEWTPPSWVFGPVWTLLYLMMAVAAWLVWRSRGWSAGLAPLALFAIQLVLNASWSVIFFGLRSPGLAFAEITILWSMVLATTVAFWLTTTPAGLLMLPYLLWVTFAGVLNFSIWRLNG